MPVATIDTSETEKFNLSTCPPDGFVVLRKFNSGESLRRNELLQSVRRGDRQFEEGEDDVTIDLNLSAASFYAFKHAVTEHNLTDKSGRALDFRSKVDFNSLHPAVHDEIERKIIEYCLEDEVKEVGDTPTKRLSVAPSSTQKEG